MADALNIRNRLKTTAIHDLPFNLFVLIWREGPISQLSYWSGLYNLLNIKNEIYTIQFPHKPTNFHSMVVKPYLVNLEITKNTQLENDKNKFFPPQTETEF